MSVADQISFVEVYWLCVSRSFNPFPHERWIVKMKTVSRHFVFLRLKEGLENSYAGGKEEIRTVGSFLQVRSVYCRWRPGGPLPKLQCGSSLNTIIPTEPFRSAVYQGSRLLLKMGKAPAICLALVRTRDCVLWPHAGNLEHAPCIWTSEAESKWGTEPLWVEPRHLVYLPPRSFCITDD